MRQAYLFFLTIALLTGMSLASAAGQPPARVFILHSYEENHVCGQPQSQGVLQALADAGYADDRLVLDVYAMDTKRKNNTPELIQKQADIAKGKIDRFLPDVLVTLDDNAFRTVALHYVGTRIPVVFSGMNNQPEKYNESVPWMKSRQSPSGNVTGVYEKIHFSTAIRIQKRIMPEMRKVRVFSDNSPTGRALVKQIQLEIESDPIPVAYDFFITDSWEAYQKAVLETNVSDVDTLYPVALRLHTQEGTTHTANHILSWTGQNTNKPTIPLNFAFVKLGIFGGAGVDFQAMGYQAGVMAARILGGEDTGNIAIEEARRYALVFHLGQAEKLNVHIPAEILLAADAIYRD